MTTQIVFTNFASTTISVPVGPSDTAITVATGTGALFANPTGDDYFIAVVTDSATKTLKEIVFCDARSGDNLSVSRGEEGTTALSWGTGDIIACIPTAATLASLFQLDAANVITGSADYTGGVITVATQATTDNTTKAASTAFARAAATSISSAGIAALGIDTSTGRQSLDGFVEAWGVYTGDSSGSSQTVSFASLVTMSDTSYNVQITRLTRGGGALGVNDVPELGTKTTTTFVLDFSSSVDSDWTYSWRIKGAGTFV